MPKLAAERQALQIASGATFMVAVCLWAATAAAQPREEGGAQGTRRGPPPEALAACKSLAAGQPCTVALGPNTLKGSCWAPDGKPLACRPAGAPVPDGGKPAAGNN